MQDWIGQFLQHERLPEAYRLTIANALLPLGAAIAARARLSDHMVVVGLCGAQGSGKSTAAAALVEMLQQEDLPSVALSIDDFYLPRAERIALSRTVHPLLVTRGVPGTHDVELALATVDSLAEDEPTLLPAFDKATDDRRPRAQWRSCQGPMRVVILEGWCVGAQPQTTAQLATPVNALEKDEDADGRWRSHVNEALATRYPLLFNRMSLLALLAAPSFEVVQRWRSEQEHRLREKLEREGGDASRVMSDAAIARFIAHYERVTRHILAEMPQRADHLISLDEQRVARYLR